MTNNSYKISDIIFVIPYSILMFTCMLMFSFFDRYLIYFKTIEYICIFILVLRELFFSRICLKDILFGLLILFFFYSTEVESELLCYESLFFLLIFFGRNVNPQLIIRISKYVCIFTLLFIVVSSKTGLITNYLTDPVRKRYYLGFKYALYPSIVMLNITYLYFLSRDNHKYDVIRFLLLLACNVWIFYQTNSRASFGISILICLCGLFTCLYKKPIPKRDIISLILVFSVLFAAFFSIFISFKYNPEDPTFYKINQILVDRLSLGNNSIKKYGISLFKRSIYWNGQGLDAYGNPLNGTYEYVDCMYLRCLIRYGLIFNLIVLAYFTYCLNIIRKKENYRLLVVFALLSGLCMIDDLSRFFPFCSMWLLLGIEAFNYAENRKIE